MQMMVSIGASSVNRKLAGKVVGVAAVHTGLAVEWVEDTTPGESPTTGRGDCGTFEISATELVTDSEATRVEYLEGNHLGILRGWGCLAFKSHYLPVWWSTPPPWTIMGTSNAQEHASTTARFPSWVDTLTMSLFAQWNCIDM